MAKLHSIRGLQRKEAIFELRQDWGVPLSTSWPNKLLALRKAFTAERLSSRCLIDGGVPRVAVHAKSPSRTSCLLQSSSLTSMPSPNSASHKTLTTKRPSSSCSTDGGALRGP